MSIDNAAIREARLLLRTHGLPCHSIVAAAGFANDVWLTPEYVIRLNSGRFRDAFRHEAEVLERLPRNIRSPKVVAYGTRAANGEYLILERLPGSNLEQAWPSLTQSERANVVAEISDQIEIVHSLAMSEWMRNPWVEDAVELRQCENAYHAPPEFAPVLLMSAMEQRSDSREILESLAQFVSSRMHAFDEGDEVFIHADLHFRNVLVEDGHLTGLVDFEGCRPAAIDVELDMLLRSLAPADVQLYPGVVGSLKRRYPRLFNHRHLISRLEVYEGLWHLVQLHHWRPGHTWTSDPIIALRWLIDGSFRDRVGSLLDEDPLV